MALSFFFLNREEIIKSGPEYKEKFVIIFK